jgi:hypothetical protein
MVLSDAKEQAKQEQSMVLAVGMGFGGYNKDSQSKIRQGWERVLSLEYEDESGKKDVYTKGKAPPKMTEAQKKFWEGLGGLVR